MRSTLLALGKIRAQREDRLQSLSVCSCSQAHFKYCSAAIRGTPLQARMHISVPEMPRTKQQTPLQQGRYNTALGQHTRSTGPTLTRSDDDAPKRQSVTLLTRALPPPA